MNGRCGDGLGLGLIVELLLVALLQISDCNGGERGQVSVVSVVRGSSRGLRSAEFFFFLRLWKIKDRNGLGGRFFLVGAEIGNFDENFDPIFTHKKSS